MDFLKKKKKGPYSGVVQVIQDKVLAKTFKIPLSDLEFHYKADENFQGLKRAYLEGKPQKFVDSKDWEACGDILALLIFGLIIFPSLYNSIDSTAISMFWVAKVHERNMAPVLLVDVYHTRYIPHDNGKGLMIRFIPSLYSWLTFILYKDVHMNKIMSIYD